MGWWYVVKQMKSELETNSLFVLDITSLILHIFSIQVVNHHTNNVIVAQDLTSHFRFIEFGPHCLPSYYDLVSEYLVFSEVVSYVQISQTMVWRINLILITILIILSLSQRFIIREKLTFKMSETS